MNNLNNTYSLHPQLTADTHKLGQLTLSDVLLMDSTELPWVILVPRISSAREWHDLSAENQIQLHQESMLIGQSLMNLFGGDKLNTGAIGNMVPQLHIHHIVRFTTDSVWPKPVWGNIENECYSAKELSIISDKIVKQLSAGSSSFIAC